MYFYYDQMWNMRCAVGDDVMNDVRLKKINSWVTVGCWLPNKLLYNVSYILTSDFVTIQRDCRFLHFYSEKRSQ